MTDWSGLYQECIRDIPRIAASSPLMLFGLSACVDARLFAHEIQPLFTSGVPQAVAFGEMVKDRARRGIGGEVRVDWPEGPSWLAENVPITYALGGTGPQAAWSLAAIGAPVLIALEDRSAHKLKQVHPEILIAEAGSARRAAEIVPRGRRQPEIFIVEYTAGMAIGDVTPQRSSRIIVRFHDPGLEHDAQFSELSIELAPQAGAGLISGFNSIPYDRIDTEVAPVRRMVEQWRAAGVRTVHLELAGYDTPRHRDRVIDRLQGAITSLGMSHSEFIQLMPETSDLAKGMCELGTKLGLDRICVHADHWAASVTRGDPEQECSALLMGCLLAGTRAAHGIPAYPHTIAVRATFTDPPFPILARHGAWSFVSCASPHLGHPKATVGLGDSFTGGCLLMLGRQRAAAELTLSGIRHGHTVKTG
jgi:ADP-specific Phosphofructokinase/Glucokinase conserved region